MSQSATDVAGPPHMGHASLQTMSGAKMNGKTAMRQFGVARTSRRRERGRRRHGKDRTPV